MAAESFKKPTPNALVMNCSGYLNEWILLRGLPLFRKLPLVKNIPPFGGYFKVNSVSIPKDDLSRLREITDPKNVFFFGPNHPEFTTDWLIDKYISTRFAPRMSSWAASSIIRGPLSRFWSANNLIGNDGGEAAKEYSISCALAGNGTLLHPEGTVRWRSDKVFDLLPGIVDMGMVAAQRIISGDSSRKVYIVPLVWKIVYDEDVQPKLNQGIAKLEHSLQLPCEHSLPLGQRYVRLHQNLLVKQMKRFGEARNESLPKLDDAEKFFDTLFTSLSQRYGIEGPREEIHRLLHRLFRKAKEAKNREDAEAVIELQRLAAYSKDTFEKEYFYQEEIAEGLQFIRQVFLTGGYDSVRSMLPKPFGWRTVHLRIPEPIEVTSRMLASESTRLELPNTLLSELKEKMDTTLQSLNKTFENRLKVMR